MKRLALALAILALFACVGLLRPSTPTVFGPVTIEAQTLPITVTVSWDANPASDNVTNYVVRLNRSIIGSPTTTSQDVTVTTLGVNTFAVRAVNLWAESPDATLVVTVAAPKTVTGLTAKKK